MESEKVDAFGAPRHSTLDGVRSIAALRANALGDLMVAMPALEAVKAAYPEAQLVLLGKPWHREFLEGRPGPVDRVIALPPIRGVSEPEHSPAPAAAPPDLLDRLRAERFDLALQLHGGGRFSNPFMSSLGAGLTAGARARGAPPLDRCVHYAYWQPEVLRYLEVVALIGADPVTLQARVTVTDRDAAEAGRAVPPGRRPLVVIHPGAGDGRRRWPPDRFALVGDAVIEAGATVAIVGTGSEAGLTAAVVGAMRRPAVDLAGQLSIGGLTGLLARSALVVGNDSGPTHLARALGVPTVAVYWAGNLLNAGPVGRGLHRTPVSWTLRCPECGVDTIDRRCEHDASFVTAVEAGEVIEEALDVMRCLHIVTINNSDIE